MSTEPETPAPPSEQSEHVAVVSECEGKTRDQLVDEFIEQVHRDTTSNHLRRLAAALKAHTSTTERPAEPPSTADETPATE